MKKKKFETYKVTEPMFKSGLTALVNCSFDECKEYIESNGYEFRGGDDDIDNFRNSLGVLYSLRKKDDTDDNRVYLLWQKNFTWTIDDMGVFIHELIHFTNTILDDKGIPINQHNDEIFAYFHEYYVKSFFQQLSHRHGRKKKTASRS